jgi:alpha-L-rhamnosidase
MKRIFLLLAVALCIVPGNADAASIIVPNETPAASQWICFRKTFDISGNTAGNSLRIAADSKYWLYVNGELEVYEGQLKRGPNPKDTYIDYVQLKHLHSGRNTVAVLVWYYGKHGFSHRNSKTGGLYFDLTVGKQHYQSDATWRYTIHPAFYKPAGREPNYRLPESNIGFDARKDIPDWFSASFDDSAWKAPATTTPELADWNRFVKREIPQWKDYGVKPYPSQRREGNVVVCTLPYNCQFAPVMKVRAKAGQTIDVRTDDYTTPAPNGEPNVFAEYVTRDGEQEYENPGWMNGHEVRYTVPEGVEVLSLGYRETGYNCSFAGSFECSDPMLNSLWKKSQRTLYITMRDSYMDCPDRERAQWIGDVSNELVEVFYALSPSANLLTRKCAREFADWQKADSVMFAPAPAGNWDRELPQQTMAFMGLGNWNYYMGTGDEATIKYVFPASKRYMHKWKIEDDGLVQYRTGAWDWGDWGDNADMQALCQAWYSTSLKYYAKQAALIGESAEAKWATAAAEKLDAAFRSKFWTGDSYRHTTYTGKTDDRTQAMAVISGIATKEQYPKLLDLMNSTEFASPYMERYVLQSMCEMGYMQDAVNRMRRRYKEMADHPLTTLWELFNLTGSYNHAWSGGPLIIMSQYIAGISPVKPAFREFQVKPQLCDLKYAKTVVPTQFGSIKLDVNQENGFRMTLTVPKDTKAHVVLPSGISKYRINGSRKSVKFNSDGSAKAVKLAAGKYVIEKD